MRKDRGQVGHRVWFENWKDRDHLDSPGGVGASYRFADKDVG